MNVNAQIAGKPGAMTAPLLAVDNVTLQYKTEQHLVTATYRVGFEVREGERFVLLGPSGCGKSTLLKAVAGFMPPVEGTMRLCAMDYRRTTSYGNLLERSLQDMQRAKISKFLRGEMTDFCGGCDFCPDGIRAERNPLRVLRVV